jgi:hypothetical protein
MMLVGGAMRRALVGLGLVLASSMALAAETPHETGKAPLQNRKVAPERNGTDPEHRVPPGGFSKLLPSSLYQPQREPAELTLGSVVAETTMPCSDNFPVGAMCTKVTVSCPGLLDAQATIGVTEPVVPAIATVILHNGGGGTTIFDNGFPDALVARGVRSVQVTWVTDWPVPAGAKVSACRPASVFRWLFDEIHGGDRTRGFCALGHSGGSAAVAYALAFYGLGDHLDFALLNSGPPLGRIDYGCEPDLYTGGPRYLCPEIPDAKYDYESSRWEEIDRIEATASCGEPWEDSTVSERARWESDSLVSTGAVFDYPQTPLAFYYCSTEPNSAVGLGSFYLEQVTSSKVVHCIGGECTGEGTYRDPLGFAQMVNDLVTSCVPNH